jgi:hypothetical protein
LVVVVEVDTTSVAVADIPTSSVTKSMIVAEAFIDNMISSYFLYNKQVVSCLGGRGDVGIAV